MNAQVHEFWMNAQVHENEQKQGSHKGSPYETFDSTRARVYGVLSTA